MTDRELLELAAKAAGYIPHASQSEMPGMLMVDHVYWSPLTDDGDALRLAVKLNMSVTCGPIESMANTISGALRGYFPKESQMTQCQFAATRRAIVRAAAAIGQGME